VVIAPILTLPLILLLRVREPAKRASHQTFEWSAFRVMLRPSYLLFGRFPIVYASSPLLLPS
jgi:hypothetical protein